MTESPSSIAPKVWNTVGDVIGQPERWRNLLDNDLCCMDDMRGGFITEIIYGSDIVAISTKGGNGGPTYSVFRITEPRLLTRLVAVLLIGMDVHRAVKLAI